MTVASSLDSAFHIMSPTRAPEFGGRSLRCSGRTPSYSLARPSLDPRSSRRTAIIAVRSLYSKTRARVKRFVRLEPLMGARGANNS